MRRSEGRILVSHAGALPRPDSLEKLWEGLPETADAFQAALPEAVSEIVRRQAEAGVDCVNDGEIGKRGGFSGYIRDRLTGWEQRPWRPDEKPETHAINGRDRKDFPGFYAEGHGRPLRSRPNVQADPIFAVAPLEYTGADQVKAEAQRLSMAAKDLDLETYLPAVAPGTMEHWLRNRYYPDEEALLFAIADVLHDEYQAIVDAGMLLQVDDPGLADGWQMFPEWSVEEYRRWARLRVDALNHALRGIPTEQCRLHMCWGSGHGPHTNDLPLRDLVDLVLAVDVGCYSIEACTPAHEHEWELWEHVKLPEGKLLMPGVVGHASGVIEHPELVAQRLVRYASLVGRENVIAGTDCGLAPRVVHQEICWAKLAALGAGAKIASERLWGR